MAYWLPGAKHTTKCEVGEGEQRYRHENFDPVQRFIRMDCRRHVGHRPLSHLTSMSGR